AHALTAAAGGEGVERAHAKIERRADPPAGMRRWGRRAERIRCRSRRQRPQSVDRFTQGVDDAPEPGLRRPHRAGGGRDHRAAATPHPVKSRERHCQRIAVGKADYLAGDGAAGAGLDDQPGANRHGVDRTGDLDHEPTHADDAAVDLHAVEVAYLLGQGLHPARASAHRAAGELTGLCRKLALRLTASVPPLTDGLPASLIIASSSRDRRAGYESPRPDDKADPEPVKAGS